MECIGTLTLRLLLLLLLVVVVVVVVVVVIAIGLVLVLIPGVCVCVCVCVCLSVWSRKLNNEAPRFQFGFFVTEIKNNKIVFTRILIPTINSHFYALATLSLVPIELEADLETEPVQTMCRSGKQSSLPGPNS